MAGSNQYTVGTVPVLLAACPPTAIGGPAGWFYLTNGGTTSVYLMGGTSASASLGPTVAAGGNVSGFLYTGDNVYGVTTAGSAVSVGVLQTGK